MALIFRETMVMVGREQKIWRVGMGIFRAFTEGGFIVISQIHFVGQINFSLKFPATIKLTLGSVGHFEDKMQTDHQIGQSFCGHFGISMSPKIRLI